MAASWMTASQMTASDFKSFPLRETGCLGNLYAYVLVALASRFLIHPYLVSQVTSGYLLLTVQHLCNLRDAMTRPLVTRYFPPNLYLGKQRISLVVAMILVIFLCSHTQLECNQFAITLNLYLKVVCIKSFACGEDFDKNIEKQPRSNQQP